MTREREELKRRQHRQKAYEREIVESSVVEYQEKNRYGDGGRRESFDQVLHKGFMTPRRFAA